MAFRRLRGPFRWSQVAVTLVELVGRGLVFAFMFCAVCGLRSASRCALKTVDWSWEVGRFLLVLRS